MRDPRWQEWSAPLLQFLAMPRNWSALNAWCRTSRFGAAKLRHCLAWLETQGLVHVCGGDEILWVQTILQPVSDLGPEN